MSLEKYLTGNRIYRHGSFAPTRGTVDPSGYVERELRKRMITPSDTRSGLAAAALMRLRGGQTRTTQPVGGTTPWGQPQLRTPQPVGGTTPVGGPQQRFPQPVGAVPGTNTASNAALMAKLQSVKAEHLAQKAQEMAAWKSKMAGRPQVSPVGKVAPSKPKPKPKPQTALPWDLEAQNAKMQETQKLAQLRNMLLGVRQGANREFSMGMQDLDQRQPEESRGLLNNFGGRGLAFGSGYGMGVGNLQNKFAGERTGLRSQLNDVLNSAAQQEAQGVGSYNQNLAMIQQALASRLAKRAGTLGLGKPPAKSKPKASVKKKAKK